MSESAPEPPKAERRPKHIDAHGETRVDEFFWLRERDDPAVRAYLEAENRHTEAVMAHTQPLQERLYEEFVSRLQEDDESVPVAWGEWAYFTRTRKGLEYPIFCRRPRGGGPETVILDANARARGHDFYDIGAVEVSPDHRLLCFTEDTDGGERFTLRVLDVAAGTEVGDPIENVSGGGIAWAEDGETLFYVTLDATRRPFHVWRHRLGSDPGQDVSVFREDDEAFFVGIGKTNDRRYLLIELGSNVTSEVHYLPAAHPDTAPLCYRRREHGVEYTLEHRHGEFFVLTNHEAEDFRLLRVPVDASHPPREYIAHQPGAKLEDFELLSGYLAVNVREQGMLRLRVYDLATDACRTLEFEESVYTATIGDNPEFDSHSLRLGYTSLVTPPRVYDCDLRTGALELLKERPIPAGYTRAAYVSERLQAHAPDGTAVPVSVVRRADTPLDGTAPGLLYGYGAYGISMDPSFSANRISLLDRGFVYAIAHIRGGGDLGEGWKNAGKLKDKPNTFSDFIAAAETLQSRSYVSPDKLAIMGGSAGGMLIGAVLNQRPELFNAAVAQVPFVDVLNTMEDPTLPLTVIEYDEWGNPADPAYYQLIRDYAPYENVREQAYPHLLVVAGINDPRVQYWEPAKWVAKLRRLKTDDNRLLLKTYMESGHMGASGRYQALRELAFDLAFILDCTGTTE